MSADTRIYTWMLPPLLELGIRALFTSRAGYEYIGGLSGTGDTTDGIQLKPGTGADILFMDFDPEFESYGRLFNALREQHPDLRILFLLSAATDESLLFRALRAKADGYLFQSVTEEVLLRAVEETVSGRSFLQAQMTPMVLAELRKPMHAMKEFDAQIPLTERERQLMQLAADGLSNVQIGDVLGLAEKTVRNLWSALFEKIGMNDRTQAVLWGIRTGQADLR